MSQKFRTAFSDVKPMWNITPFLYRYENQNFIDHFFETGELMISCFSQYIKHPDNELGDSGEGSVVSHVHSDSASIFSVYAVGSNAYTFCLSTILSKTLIEKFSRNSVFMIKDVVGFMHEIQRSIPRVNEMLLGNCIYAPDRTLSIKKEFTINDIETDGGSPTFSLDKILSINNDPEAFFIKKLKYQHQNEYRLIWNTDRLVKEPLIINCPEAIKYCEKIDLNKINS
jgi:hypothetical protein